jgi:phosphoadenosine phosphosulfate reductase
MTETKVTYNNFTSDVFQDIDIDNETKGAYEVLKWAYDSYGDNIIYSCSFGAEGMILIDLISKVRPDAKIVFLDTDLHFQETYDLIDRVKERYPELNIELKKPDLTLDEQSEQYGPALWKKDPNQCCYIRKIKPLEEVLSGATAWVSGLRREQSPSRQNTRLS